MLASLASVSISVTNVLAVEPSKRLVHRSLVARVPQALEATHPHPDATRAVAIMLFHNVVGARDRAVRARVGVLEDVPRAAGGGSGSRLGHEPTWEWFT